MSDTKQSQSLFWSFNYVVGVASFFAILFGSVGVYSSLGARGLRESGVKMPFATEKTEFVGAVSYVSTILGFAGVGSATALAYIGGTIAADREYKRNLVAQSYRKQDKESFYVPPQPRTPQHAQVEVEGKVQGKVYMYRLTKNEQIAGNDLIILGYVSLYCKAAFFTIAERDQVDALMVLFECGEKDLIGKAFTSFCENAADALDDYLSRQAEFMKCLASNYREDIEICVGCVHLCDREETFCPIHEEGWRRDGKCPDKQLVANYPMAPYEDYSAIYDAAIRIQDSNVYLGRNDDGTIDLYDDVTMSMFTFDWFGKVQGNRLVELPFDRELESYLEYYSKRDITQFKSQVPFIDEFKAHLNGIAEVKVVGLQSDISVTLFPNQKLGIHCQLCYKFNQYGYAKFPWETKIPVALKGECTIDNFVQSILDLPPTNDCDKPFYER